MLDKEMPPVELEPESADHERGLTQRRILNDKLRTELRYELTYPTFRQGYAAEIHRLKRTGELKTEPDPE